MIIDNCTELDDRLQRNWTFYERILPTLLPVHCGKHVLIFDGRLVGLYLHERDATDAGYAISDGTHFLVERVHPDGPGVRFFPSIRVVDECDERDGLACPT